MSQTTPSSKAPEKTGVKGADKTTRRPLRELPAEWIPSKDPKSGAPSMFKYYEDLAEQYTKNDVRPRFRMWKDSTGQGFHSIQRPGPHPIDAKFAREERVYMIATSLDGTEEFYLVPLAEVEQRETQGWKLWKCPSPPLDDDGKDRRRCNFPVDVITTDRPHEDFEFYFPPSIVNCVKRTVAPPNWKPGMPLEQEYDEEDNISTAKTFRPPNEWEQVVTGSSNGHIPIIRTPRDMVEKKNWVTEFGDFKYVDADDPNSTITISPSSRLKEAFKNIEQPKPLYDFLLDKAEKTKIRDN
ncbi:hypothetical protein F5Y10DRAFT_264762 [Nemania abortiva]|nr:hypothetical protein F5Y10DRAFT_264762 [Nemania abortiva]